MTTGGYLLTNFVGAAISGAIGAGVSQDAKHPVIKGAIVTGLISAGIAAVFLAGATADKQVGTSGVGHLPLQRGFP